MLKTITFAICAAVAVPAVGQVTSAEDSNPVPKGKDPNRKICERVEKIGSRLNTVTVCRTAREWEDLRSGHREDLENVQRIVNTAPACTPPQC